MYFTYNYITTHKTVPRYLKGSVWIKTLILFFFKVWCLSTMHILNFLDVKIYFPPPAKQANDPRKRGNFQQRWQQQQKDYVGNYTGIISKTNKKYTSQIFSELYIIVLNMVIFGENFYTKDLFVKILSEKWRYVNGSFLDMAADPKIQWPLLVE